jgi:hypothetical protein
MKKATSILILFAMLLALVNPANAAAITEPQISPRYTNAETVTTDISISTSGVASVVLNVSGYANLETISVTTYIEKYNYGMWVRVNIGTTNNEWTYSYKGQAMRKTYSYTLTSSGQYRAVSLFTLAGDTTETITVSDYTSF